MVTLVIAVMKFFASDSEVFFCKESQANSRNVARISLYPAFRAKTAKALAFHRVAEIDLGTLICFVSKQSLRRFQRKHDAEKHRILLQLSQTMKLHPRKNLRHIDRPNSMSVLRKEQILHKDRLLLFWFAYCTARSYCWRCHTSVLDISKYQCHFPKKKRSKVTAKLAPVWL